MKVHQIAPNIYAEVGLSMNGYLTSHYSQLIGRTVESIVFEKFDGCADQPVPVLRFTDGTSAAVMQDPEGNGPGHLEIITP